MAGTSTSAAGSASKSIGVMLLSLRQAEMVRKVTPSTIPMSPRSEKPEAICEDVAAGFRAEKNRLGSVCRVEVDRASAIIDAIAQAGAGDVVVVAGKGHEDYQLVADRRLDLDDRGIIRDWIGREARP